MDGVIIQARTGSTRLPGKILLPFYGEKRIIDIQIEAIRAACPGMRIVLATTTRRQDNVLADVARQMEVDCYRGSEDDVLGRFIGAAEQFGINRLIRVCSDNPFLRADSFQALLEAHDCQPADYVAFGWPDGRPTIKSHIGLFAELTTLDALRRAASLTDEQLYHEHVTIYLYTHPEAFSVRLLPLPTGLESRQDLRFTLDTPDDFSPLGSLYAEWYEKTDRSLSALLQTVDARPEYLERMRENIKRNEK